MKATGMNMAKRIAVATSGALLIVVLGLTGCASSEQENASEESNVSFSTESRINQIEVPLKVITYGEGGRVLFDEVVTIGEGSTALDVLQATGLELDAQNGEYGMFVNAVDGIATEGMKGWAYTVNGEQVQTSADQTYLNDGDTVEWSYIDMGA